MRHTTKASPSAILRRRPASRVSELARFAARINRAMTVDVDQEIVIITPRDLESLRYQEIHLEVGRINDLLRLGGFRKLLVDLSERQEIEPVILTAIVGFCRAIPGSAAFCNVSREILESTHSASLFRLWPVFASRSDALAAMSEGTDGSTPEWRRANVGGG
jgi:hypothetical protein